MLKEFENNTRDKFTFEQRKYLNQVLAPQPEQEEPKLEQTQAPTEEIIPETIEEKEDEEEPITASVNLMVKIAQKLDLKKKYRLADKLTYIIRKKI